MIWIALAILLTVVFVVGNLRVWRSENIRAKCIDMAITSRTLGGRAYIYAEKNHVIIERAAAFERYIFKGKPEVSNPQPSPPKQ